MSGRDRIGREREGEERKREGKEREKVEKRRRRPEIIPPLSGQFEIISPTREHYLANSIACRQPTRTVRPFLLTRRRAILSSSRAVTWRRPMLCSSLVKPAAQIIRDPLCARRRRPASAAPAPKLRVRSGFPALRALLNGLPAHNSAAHERAAGAQTRVAGGRPPVQMYLIIGNQQS